MHRSVLVGLPIASLLLAAAATASAAVECPPGSVKKVDGTNEWCQPSVCSNDGQCAAGEVCKPVPLCVETGTLKPSGAALADAGAPILMARQKCGEDKSCPSSTVCSQLSRCLSRADAEKMNLLGAASAAPAGSSSTDAGKKTCGCSVPGAPANDGVAVGLAALACAIGISRRRTR